MIAILHNIRSVYNVASMFRTADGAGVEKLYLTGYTPAPIDRFGRSRDKFHKVALGAEDTVTYEQSDDIHTVIKNLKNDDKTIYACEPTAEAISYRQADANKDSVLIFGNEPNGLPQDVLDAADSHIKIPMHGEKSSLNVSVAFGVITHRVIDNK